MRERNIDQLLGHVLWLGTEPSLPVRGMTDVHPAEPQRPGREVLFTLFFYWFSISVAVLVRTFTKDA